MRWNLLLLSLLAGPAAAQTLSPPAPAVAPAVPHAQAAPADAGTGPLYLSGNDEQRVQDCTGRPVMIEGDRNAYVLRGGCQSLSVQGDVDTVQAELQPGAPVSITGQGTTVSWALLARGKAPVITLQGDNNRVQRADMIGGEPVR